MFHASRFVNFDSDRLSINECSVSAHSDDDLEEDYEEAIAPMQLPSEDAVFKPSTPAKKKHPE